MKYILCHMINSKKLLLKPGQFKKITIMEVWLFKNTILCPRLFS